MTPGGLEKSLMAQRPVPADNLLTVALFPPSDAAVTGRRGQVLSVAGTVTH